LPETVPGSDSMLPEPTASLTALGESLTLPPKVARNGCPRDPCSDTDSGAAMRDLMAVTKALADENRVRMLLALRHQELCVCQIVALMRLATSTVSKHMSILKQARLVDSRKEGRWMYYRLAGSEESRIVRQAVQWLFHSLANDPQVLRDQERLRGILKLDPHELCEAQRRAEAGCECPPGIGGARRGQRARGPK